MKESKEETKLQSEQKTAEEILKDFIRKETEYLQSCNPTNELGEITGNDFAAGLVRGMNKVLEEYASQFKSQLPIEQKNELELIIAEKNIDIIHLRDRIKELESQPSPIEGVEREQLREAFEAGQHADDYDQWVKHNYDFDEWLATRKGSTSGE